MRTSSPAQQLLRSPRAIFGVALFVRLLIIAFGPQPAHDDGAYFHAVMNYFHGLGLTYEANVQPGQLYHAYLPPVYPMVLIAYLKLLGLGASLLPLRLLITLAGCGNCLMVYGIGRRAGGENVGLIAGWIMALYLPQALDSTALNSLPIAASLAIAVVYCLARFTDEKNAAWIFLAGATAGLTALSRGEYATMNGWIVLWLAIYFGAKLSTHRMAGVKLAAVYLVGMAVVMGPWVIRNYRMFHRIVPLSTNYGDNFYFAFNPNYKFSGEANYYDSARLEKLARGLNEVEVSDMLMAEGKRFIRENPGRAAKTVLLNFCYFWRPFLSTKKYSLKNSIVYFCFYFPMFCFALLGLSKVDWKQSTVWALLAGIIVVKSLSHLFFYVIGHFRESLVPFMIVLSAQGLWWFWQRRAKNQLA